jgi:hypothetical protein
MTSRSTLARAAAALALPVALAAGPAHAVRHTARAAAYRQSSMSLHRVSIPDGSGTLALPAGWRITDYGQGLATAMGPQGAVSFGFHVPMLTPAGARYYASMGMRPAIAIARSGDPGQVAVDMGRLSGARNVRLLKEIKVPGVGPTAFVMTKFEMPGIGKCGCMGYIDLIPGGDGQRIEYYASTVAAPAARFARTLPLLLQIWQSWKTDDSVFRQRLAQAADRMRQTSETISGVINRREAAQANAHHKFDLYIRGHEEVDDAEDPGHRREVDANGLDHRIDAANKRAGYERYHKVP